MPAAEEAGVFIIPVVSNRTRCRAKFDVIKTSRAFLQSEVGVHSHYHL